MKSLLLISRCPPYPLYLGDRLIVYHLARELSQRGWAIDLLAFSSRLEDLGERPHYADYFRRVELIPEPRRTQVSYLWRLLNPSARWPRRIDETWSPEMWQAIATRLAETQYDAIHLFGGIQVYEYRHLIGERPAIIAPYESYSLYLRRMVERSYQRSAVSGQRKKSDEYRVMSNDGLRVDPAVTNAPNSGKREKLRSESFQTTSEKNQLITHHLSLISHYSSLITSFSLRVQYRIARTFESWIFSPYRRVVVVSPPDRDELRAINPALNVEVIPNGIDLDYFQPQSEARESGRLLFVGNYEYAPNVDAGMRLATEILPQVQKRFPEAKLWLVGNAPPPELTALQGDSVEVTGRVPDVRPHYARASVFVSALRLGAGIKNKVLEALAMGCPVVATPLSADGIEVESGRDVLIAEGGELVEAIVRLLGDDDLRATLAANGRALIEARYTWGRVAEMYENLYTSNISE